MLEPATVDNGIEKFEQPTKISERPSYLPTLDGWRAIAITLVILNHSRLISVGPFNTAPFRFLGEYAVEIFFALSGFLICSRLLDEERITGNLHRKRFYIRRLFRIQPVALLYLLCVVVLTLMGLLEKNVRGLVAAVVLLWNYLPTKEGSSFSQWPTAHFWSLSVEEHFYLFLPTFLALVKKHRARWLIGIGILDFGWRLFCSYPSGISFATQIRTDASLCFLLIPAGIAVLLGRPRWQHFAIRYMHPFWVIPAFLPMLPNRSPIHELLGISSICLIVSTLTHPMTFVSRFLESPPLRFVGRISYSLYIWQALFLHYFVTPNSFSSQKSSRSGLCLACLL